MKMTTVKLPRKVQMKKFLSIERLNGWLAKLEDGNINIISIQGDQYGGLKVWFNVWEESEEENND